RFHVVELDLPLFRLRGDAREQVAAERPEQIFDRARGLVRIAQARLHADPDLVVAKIHAALAAEPARADRPGMRRPGHQKSGSPVSALPTKSCKWSTVGAMTQPARASRKWRSTPSW